MSEKKKIFETVSFHLTKPCNMSCKFCYATYNSFKVGKQLHYLDVNSILYKLKDAGVKKVTFAGGEPMLYHSLDWSIFSASNVGLTTSIVTNGSMLTERWLRENEPFLDWIGISIDSTSYKVNKKIGRVTNKQALNYRRLIKMIRKYNYKLKINTVVNVHNQHEDMTEFIEWAKPDRWKVFDTLKVEGQNESQFNDIKSTDYQGFIERNKCDVMVAEDNDLMTKSYLLIDPLGRFYENWGSDTKKSDSLITHSVEHCLKQVQLDREKFLERGGIYEW